MRTTFIALGLAVLVSACGSNGGSGTPDGGNPPPQDGPNYGDGGVVMPPYVDPGTNKWMCYADDGSQHVCQCNDDMDNDGDTMTDGADAQCAMGGWVDSEASGPGTNCGMTQCTNCMDDDMDGLEDSADPECTGPLDDDEGSFATGIPGDNMDDCHQDCWFDGDSGQGNDGCNWRLGCDPVAGPAYGCNMPGNCDNAQTDGCRDFCQVLTPNGCDCFGCCDIYVDGVPHTVHLDPNGMCSVETINDPMICVPCTKVPTCENPCDPCEWCLGRPPAGTCDYDAGMGYTCPDGQVACTPGPDGATCPPGYYCLTGCCINVIP